MYTGVGTQVQAPKLRINFDTPDSAELLMNLAGKNLFTYANVVHPITCFHAMGAEHCWSCVFRIRPWAARMEFRKILIVSISFYLIPTIPDQYLH